VANPEVELAVGRRGLAIEEFWLGCGMGAPEQEQRQDEEDVLIYGVFLRCP
jgi:hypothetical protein